MGCFIRYKGHKWSFSIVVEQSRRMDIHNPYCKTAGFEINDIVGNFIFYIFYQYKYLLTLSPFFTYTNLNRNALKRTILIQKKKLVVIDLPDSI